MIGSLSGPNFPIRTAKMDRSLKDLTKSCFAKILEERTVLYLVLAFLSIILANIFPKMAL